MIEYTVGDTKPDMVIALQADGEPVGLSDVLSVTLRIIRPDATELEKAMQVDVAQGLVAATWEEDDFDQEGEFLCDVLIVRNDGSRQHGLRRFKIRVRSEYYELDA